MGSSGRLSLRGIPWVAVLLVATVVIVAFRPLVELVRDWIRDPNYSHGFLLPLISAYLIWKKRNAILATPIRPSWVGLPAILLSAGLFLVGTAGAEVFTQRVSLLLLLASLILWLQGWRRLGAVTFPIALLLLAIPLPYVIYYGVTAPMQRLAAQLAVHGIKAVGIPAIAQGNMIHLPQGSLEVAEACSGIRSLYAFLAVGALVAVTTAIPWWGRTLVFLTTIPLAILGNGIRVWLSGLGAYLIGPQVTHGLVHEMFGIIVFLLVLALFLLLRKVARVLWSSDTLSRSSSSALLERMPGSSAPAARMPEGSPSSKNSP